MTCQRRGERGAGHALHRGRHQRKTTSKEYVKRHTQGLLYDALLQARVLERVRLETLILVGRHNEVKLRSFERQCLQNLRQLGLVHSVLQ